MDERNGTTNAYSPLHPFSRAKKLEENLCSPTVSIKQHAQEEKAVLVGVFYPDRVELEIRGSKKFEESRGIPARPSVSSSSLSAAANENTRSPPRRLAEKTEEGEASETLWAHWRMRGYCSLTNLA